MCHASGLALHAKHGLSCSFSRQIAVNWRPKLSESPAANEVMCFVFSNFSALRALFFNNSLVFNYFLASFLDAHVFSLTYWLRSYYSLCFFVPPLRGCSGPVRFPSRFGGPPRLPTTMCPHQDHLYRLSQVPEFVKRKMQTPVHR